jgi:hypothetical protein
MSTTISSTETITTRVSGGWDVVDTTTGDYRSYRWLSVRNMAETPTDCIRHVECGETKLRHGGLAVRAHLASPAGAQLKVADLTDVQPSFVQRVAIHFPRALAPGAELNLFYRLSWPGEGLAYPDHEHSQSIALARYWQGVGDVEFGLLANTRLASIRATRITASYLKTAAEAEPEPFAPEHDPDLEPLRGKGFEGYTFRFSSDDVLGYRILYRPQTETPLTADEF